MKTALALALLLLVGCNSSRPPSRVASVKVLPEQAQILLLASITYTLEVRDAAGNLLEGLPAIWESSDTSVAMFRDPSKPTALGVGLGKTQIRAIVEGKTSEPAELEVVAQGGGGGCNFPKARWKGPVKNTIRANGPTVGNGTFVVEGDVTFESALDACTLNLLEGTVSIQGSTLFSSGCTLSKSGSGPVKPIDGAITLENRPRDTPPRVKYTGVGQSTIEKGTITVVCPDPKNNYTVTGPLAFGWLFVPLTPEFFTDPNLSSFSDTYTLQSSEGSSTFEWSLRKQPLTP